MADRWAPDRLNRDAYLGPGLDLPVLYRNLDTNGHMNNVELGTFFEHARGMHFSRTGFWKATYGAGGRALVARVAIDYLREIRLGAVLHVRSRVGRIGTSSTTMEQAAWVDDSCVALAEVVFVHLDDSGSAPWPEAAREVLEATRVSQ